MPAVKRFEELDAWKKSRKLACEIYMITREGSLNKDFRLCDQIQRASVSVMSNIAEGFGYKSDKQFIHYLNISRSSGYEVQSLLYVALDVGHINDATFERLYTLAEDAISKIAGLQRYLRS